MSKNRFICTACVSSHLISFLAHRYTKTLCAFPFFAWCLIFNDTHPTRITASPLRLVFSVYVPSSSLLLSPFYHHLYSHSPSFKAAVCFCKTSFDFFCFFFFCFHHFSFFMQKEKHVCVSWASDLTCPWAVSFSVLKIKCVCYEKPHKQYWSFTE